MINVFSRYGEYDSHLFGKARIRARGWSRGMKITHYCNSFIVVEAGDTIFACDPWIGLEDQNAWATYPIHKDNGELLQRIDPDAIYISHLHFDHFDRKTLVTLANKDVRFVIKTYRDHRLAGRIRELGFTTVDECEPWTEIEISSDLSVTIVPQDTNNVAGFDADIVYDLDTSIIIRDRRTNEIFYNNVDNPLSVDGFGKVRAYCLEHFGKGVGICCVPVGAASEFPQCFPKLDRVSEGRRIVNDALENFKRRMDALKPEAYFFAGGSYVVYGKFGCLNQYIAQPSMDELERFVDENLDMQFIHPEGGRSLTKQGDSWVMSDDFDGARFASRAEAIAAYKDLAYDYKVVNYTVDEIRDLFAKARENYFRVLDRMKVEMRWIIDFIVYDDLLLTEKGDIDPACEPVLKITLGPDGAPEIIQHLVCHLDSSLFGRLLAGDHIWNQSISGTHIIYEREPNVFMPDVPSSLNFLKA
jgi:L-ascorbate metabolism protein UlaG (beta-lactamase superfamily)